MRGGAGLIETQETENTRMGEYANSLECKQITELICSEETIGKHYLVELLKTTARTAKADGVSQFGCKGRKNIIAHAATYAENRDTAVIGGAIVDKRY